MRNAFSSLDKNSVPVKLIIALGMVGGAVVAGITYYATPKTPGWVSANPTRQL